MKPSTKTTPSGGDIQITLGDGWQRFAFTTRGLAFLGTIRRGMEIGALARDEAGGYLQVNGDIHQVLNKSRVAAHLRTRQARIRLGLGRHAGPPASSRWPDPGRSRGIRFPNAGAGTARTACQHKPCRIRHRYRAQTARCRPSATVSRFRHGRPDACPRI